LKPYENNTRKHTPDDIDQIKASIEAGGFNDPIAIWGKNNLIVEGHGRQIAALEMGLDKVPCIRLDHMTETQRRDYAIRHNRTAELSGWDFGKLEEEIAALEIEGVDLSGLKFELEGLDEEFGDEKDSTDERKGSMADKYLVPPFSVIYTNKPDWLSRKRAWVNLGLHSEIGRGGTCLQYKEQSRGKLPTTSGGVQESGDEQGVQEQYKVKQLHDRSQALATFTIARMRQMKGK
jgi:hypothetical protein